MSHASSEKRVDFDSLIEVFENDMSIVNGLFESLRVSLDESFGHLKSNLDKQDLEQASIYAHGIKGSAGSCGATQLASIAGTTEDACRKGQTEEAIATLEALQQEIGYVIQEIDERSVQN